MDDDQGVLAYMAFRIVDNRRRDLADTIGRRLLADNGQVSADEIRAQLDIEWVEPDPQEIRDIVARKAQSAVEYHQRESAEAAKATARLEDKAARLEQHAAEARLAVDGPAVEAEAALGRAREAERIEVAAVAAGGVPGRAPTGMNAEASAQVADVVAEATAGGV